jgi:hypothetical protein
MTRIPRGAIVFGLAVAALVSTGPAARAQETTGRVTGRVVDSNSGAAVPGVTVIVQGPQGEDATLTDEKGQYYFTTLPVGTYVIRFYVAATATQVEQPGVVVTAERTVRVNVKIAAAAQAAAQQTYVITGKAPAIDIGSARIGTVFDGEFNKNVPNGPTYGDVISKAPGTFVDPSGNVSIGGATGLENIYVVNGMNVTGLEMGNLESGAASLGGGTNLPLEFLTQIDVNAGGYQAEYGGAMGGVINTVLKSGSNDFHGSVFTNWSPYLVAGDPRVVGTNGGALGSVRKPDYDTTIGVEVGGPIIKDKLFFWVGLAPHLQKTHVFRLTYALQEDPNNPGSPQLDANGNYVSKELTDWRARINETRQVWNYAATVDFVPTPDHRLTLGLFGTPSYNDQMRSFGGFEAIANPDWSREALTKTNTDATLHWTSKLFDRHWQLELLGGLHNEYFNDRSPIDALNNLNQLEIYGSDLYTLEGAPGCKPAADGFVPCPVNPFYHTGGWGLVRSYTAQRWMTEVKSTHLFDAGGHHEVKYGWHLEYETFDQDRYYTGPAGARGLVQINPDQTFNAITFFTLKPGEFPSDFGTMGTRYPNSDLLVGPDYDEHLAAHVKSISNAFFLQEGYSPEALRNLTVNVGARLELQKMYDTYGKPFLDTDNLAPRLGAVYDPMNDGRSKVSVSYGRYFEAIPMNIAARYFGGEGILYRNAIPAGACQNPNLGTWTGAGEWKQCPLPTLHQFDDTAGSSFAANSSYPVQADLRGQYHNEIVATVEREVMEDLTVRADYVHRWLGTIVEDGSGVLANPGDVPDSAITKAKAEVYDAEQAVKAAPNDANAASVLTNAQYKLQTLQQLAKVPKPERNYDALTLSVNKRFAKYWFARAAYTYSRLIGNYEGLFQNETTYFAPNGNNAYDFPDLIYNSRGPLPNDRPHLLRLDGYASLPFGENKNRLTGGLSFSAQSGMPRNDMSALLQGYQLVFLLPRGSAGRTPTVTQLDLHFAYQRALSPKVNLEGFMDFFNILNQQTPILMDDNYTFQAVAPIVNGTQADLKYAKDVTGAPLQKNANFGNALAYQAPFHARLGLRLTF